MQTKHIIIMGITQEGKRFQPSDWAERLSGTLSTLRNRRIVYCPLLQPATHEGIKSLFVDVTLRDAYPAVYDEVISFAQKNGLKVLWPD